jgi:hypothetical protein
MEATPPSHHRASRHVVLQWNFDSCMRCTTLARLPMQIHFLKNSRREQLGPERGTPSRDSHEVP